MTLFLSVRHSVDEILTHYGYVVVNRRYSYHQSSDVSQ